jgi:hypothetical protein
MRTNLLFGDVRFDEDVKTAKEIERRQWLNDLQKQIEDNKRNKFTLHETERRQDFLNENVQPLVQEAANRHQQQNQTSTKMTNGQDLSKLQQHDSIVQQTYDKILEAAELAKYDKRTQLMDKLKRNGHQIDSLAKTVPGKQYHSISHAYYFVFQTANLKFQHLIKERVRNFLVQIMRRHPHKTRIIKSNHYI